MPCSVSMTISTNKTYRNHENVVVALQIFLSMKDLSTMLIDIASAKQKLASAEYQFPLHSAKK